MYRLEYVDTSIFIQKKKEDKNVTFGHYINKLS